MGVTATPDTRPIGHWQDALLFTAAVVLCWTVLPAVLQTVPHADNVEQLNWSHSLQWGYLKHPPLPTALLWAASALAGPSAFLTYLLAMLCVGASLLLIWRCALVVAGRPMALLALLLSSTNYYLMGRGSFLNHNTVMLPFVAGSALLVLRIIDARAGRTPWPLWVLLGVVQALGLLTKYQMAIVIAANAAALLCATPWREAGHRGPFLRNVALCTAATALPLLPHFLWLQQHAFSTFTYAGQNLLADLSARERVVHTLGFVAQQIGRLAPVGAALGLALLLQRLQQSIHRHRESRGRGRTPGRMAGSVAGSVQQHLPPHVQPHVPPRIGPGLGEQPPAPADAGAPTVETGTAAASRAERLLRGLWLLALVPLSIELALALLAGVAPQNHWGASATLLLPLLLAVRLRPAQRPAPVPALAATVSVHTLAVVWNVVAAHVAPGFHHSFAARPLAGLALAHWQSHRAGPLRIVVGPDWEAGAIALELPSNPAVMASGDRRQAPWITDAQLAGCGALVVWRPEQPPADQVGAALAGRITAPVILEARSAAGVPSTIAAGILAPTAPGCPAPAP